MEKEKFLSLIDEVINNKLSDLHITTGDYPYIRTKTGGLQPVAPFGKVSIDDMNDIVQMMYEDDITEKIKTIDTSFERWSARFRVNISRVIHGWSISMRMISEVIPTPEEIGITENIMKLTTKDKWIILITGPTGSGKSTTLASLVDYINSTSTRHIITLEDPIEFTFENKKSLIHQREYGRHFDSFLGGIRSVLREDPDVIIVGEMRDLATIEAAITLAETGHLVISTLHTNDTVQTVDRIIQSFPAQSQNQIRIQLGLALIGVISQVLLPRIDGTGRIAAREILINNDSIRNLIIRGETQHMYSMIEISRQDGMVLMDDAVTKAFTDGLISKEEALRYIRDKDRLEPFNER